MLLDQSGARWKNRWKGEEKASDTRSKLPADDSHQCRGRSAYQKARRALLPGGLADTREVYGNLGHAFASQMNQSPKAAAPHTIMAALLATTPFTLCRIMSQLTQHA